MAARCWAVNTNTLLPAGQRGWYYSDNHGVTWTQDITKTLPVTGTLVNGFKILSNKHWLLASNDALPKFYVSTDAGITWTLKFTGAAASVGMVQCWEDDVQIFSITAGSASIYTSSDEFGSVSVIDPSAGGWPNRGATRNLITKKWCSPYRTNAPQGYVALAGVPGLVWTTVPVGSDQWSSPYTTWNVNGFYLGYQLGAGGGIAVITDTGIMTATYAGGTIPLAISVVPANWALNRVTAADMLMVSQGTANCVQSATGLAPWSAFAAVGMGTSQKIIWRMEDGGYIVAGIWSRSTDGGHNWSLTTWEHGQVPDLVTNFALSYTPHDLVPGPKERPHQFDRGLPIEIAGPRNDTTRKAYLPFVRIYS